MPHPPNKNKLALNSDLSNFNKRWCIQGLSCILLAKPQYNTIGWDSFFYKSLGLNILPGSCALSQSQHEIKGPSESGIHEGG